ncbi:helix-turn-helix domain-containing protein [Exiguobacterium undae]|uniref:helix-turn-helix domain-containing protein n=1 Tax=Exiguobacterium undae TaxID=169177 RepID=UPI0005544D1C|nr:helix-turn-helix transcriptional regulator [Exiguobacterium undae]
MRTGKKILYFRKKKGLTQSELAHGICSVPYLSKLENGKLSPSEEILTLLAKRLGHSLEFILKEEKNVLDEKLKVFKSFLDQRDIINLSKIHNEIQKLVYHEEDPYLINKYEIYHLQFLILINDKNLLTFNIDKFILLEAYLDEKDQYIFYKTLGKYHYKINSLNSSLTYFQKAYSTMNQNLNEDYDLFFQLSLVYSRLMNPSTALIYAQRALIGFESQVNYERALNCNLLLSVLYNDLSSPNEAKLILTKILNHNLPKFLPENFEVKIYQNLGYSYFLLKDYERALVYFKKSYLKKKLTSEKLNSLYMICLSLNQNSTPNYFDFYKYLNIGLSLSVAEKNKNYHYKFLVLKHFHTKKGPNKLFIVFLENKVIPEIHKSNDFNFLSVIYMYLENYYRTNFQYKSALHYSRKLAELN